MIARLLIASVMVLGTFVSSGRLVLAQEATPVPVPSATAHSNASAQPPVGPPPVRAVPKFEYGLQATAAFPYGNLGYNIDGLLGSIQGDVGYHIDPLTKIQAATYQFPSALIGLNGTAPLFIRGVPHAVATAHLPQTNDSAVYRNGVLTASRTFFIDGHAFDITPGYLFSYDEYDDGLSVNNNGVPTPIKARTLQRKLLALSTPIVLNRKFVLIGTAATQWLVHGNGLNQTNHAQLELTAYSEYFANKHASFFFEPSKTTTYNESDPYPEHDFIYAYGLNYRIAKPFFVQALVFSLNPTNYRGPGVLNLTCTNPTCRVAAPTIGSYKFSSIELSVGIGKPIVPPI